MSKICVVVPTYNEATNLPRLVARMERTLRNVSFDLIVIDDDSPDNTARVAEGLNSIYKNITVKVRANGSGLGSALLAGLNTALSKSDVEWIVTLDADFSHDPIEIPKLLCATGAADLVQGSRYVRDGAVSNWSFRRRLVSFLANLICRLMVRSSVRDCTGNFRVYSRRCAEVIVNSAGSEGFEWVVEAMAITKKCGFRVKEVPITFSDRTEGKTKLKSSQVLSWAAFALKSLFLH
jgi:dolichol-phosphate mannosyltransferase